MNCVAAHLTATGKTQKQLAEQVGVSQPTVSEWVRGLARPAGDNLARLADALGSTPGAVIASFYDNAAA